MPVTATGDPYRSSLDRIASGLATMPAERRREFLASLSADELAIIQQALSFHEADGWRRTPVAMAVHLTKRRLHDRIRDYRYMRFLGEKFRRLVSGEEPRQIWNMPARYGKSTVASRWGPAWLLDQRPWTTSILTSYGDDLANENAIAVREILREYSTVLRATLKQDRQRMDRFVTDVGGGIMAAGINASITGFGVSEGGILVVDDPFKNWPEAHRLTVRDAVWNNYRSVLRTRLDSENCGILIVHCVAEGEPVLTEAGSRAIETIRPGDRVWAYSEDGPHLRRVLDVRCEGPDDLIRVRTRRGAVSTNERHPFLVIRHQAKIWNPRWVKAGDLAVGDIVVSVAELPQSGRAPVTEWDNEEAVWLLGYLFGDGWVNRRVRKNQQGQPTSWAVFCACGVRPDENERVAAGLAAIYGRRPTFVPTQRYFRLDCNQAGRDLEALGLTAGVGARAKRLPSWLFTADPRLQRAFLDGLLEADGHQVERSYARRLGTSSEQLARDAHEVARLCGVRSVTPRGYRQTVQPPNSPAPIDSTCWKSDFAFPDHELRGGGLVKCAVPPGVRLDRIQEITTEAARPVWDLTIDTDESFFAGGFVVHNTRWHEDDLTGRLMHGAFEETGDEFTITRLPSLAEEPDYASSDRILHLPDPLGRVPGEPLCPERFPLSAVNARERALGTYLTAGLERQRPAPEEGGEIKRAWFVLETSMPTGADEWLTSWDVKLKDVNRGSFVVGTVWARTGSAMWLLDVFRGRWSMATTINAVALAHVRWPQATAHLVENTGFGPEVMTALRRAEPDYRISDDMAGDLGMTELERVEVEAVRRHGLTGILPINPKGDKVVRARAISAIIEAGDVHLPERASWLGSFLDEVASFPDEPNDQVDSMSQALSRLDRGPATLQVPGRSRDDRPAAPATIPRARRRYA